MTVSMRFPAEWEHQAAVLIAWPHAETDWAPRLAAVETTYSRLAAEISKRQSVLLCTSSEGVQNRALACLESSDAQLDNVRFVRVPYNDTWLRDSGPITLRSDAGRDKFSLLDFRFTGWGGKYAATLDDALVAELHAKDLFANADVERVDFALEGGAIETDGAGVLLTTWRCLHERHPTLSRADIEHQLKRSLRQSRVLWLDHGYLEGDDTDAHIDTLARFANRQTLVFQGCDDPADPHFDELKAMATELGALRDVEGQPYRCLELPWAAPIIDDGRRLAASYANFLIINGAVLMPAYDDPADVAAQDVLASAFPDREIVPIPCRPLIWQNGSLHCITMQLPGGLLHD